MSTLMRAIDLAVWAHARQEDPPGEPYILHPMRVMLSLPEDDHRLRMVGILHDSVERGRLTWKLLGKEKLPKKVIQAVRLMTHDKSDSYADYVIKLKPDRLARLVKLADLTDNAQLRLVDMRSAKAEKDKKRVVRYALSYKYLTNQISTAEYRNLMHDAES